jgi:hypothetical protein
MCNKKNGNDNWNWLSSKLQSNNKFTISKIKSIIYLKIGSWFSETNTWIWYSICLQAYLGYVINSLKYSLCNDEMVNKCVWYVLCSVSSCDEGWLFVLLILVKLAPVPPQDWNPSTCEWKKMVMVMVIKATPYNCRLIYKI